VLTCAKPEQDLRSETMKKLMLGKLAREQRPNRTTKVRNTKPAVLLFFSVVLGTGAFGQTCAPYSVKRDVLGESLETCQHNNRECAGNALQFKKEGGASFCEVARKGYTYAETAVKSKRAGSVRVGFASAEDSPNVAAPRPEAELPKTSAAPGIFETTPDIEGHERILFVVPAFGVTNRQNAPALSPAEKFSLASRQVFDPFVWISTGIQAGISQANNEFPQYGQGAAGYTRRYGAAMLDAVHGGFASTAFCVLLKQDPRYFRLGQGPIKHRIFYSLGQQFSAKGDNGKRQFNWANVLGTFASGAISNAYYPRPNRGFGLTMNRSAVSLLWGFTGELAEEFWPDVKRKLPFHRVEKTR
jgi:hypothetical protein